MPSSPRPCPACGRPLGTGTAPAACLRCQALYHPECWDPLAACLAYGCAGTPSDKVADLERTPPPRPCPACRHENPAGGSLCLSCGKRLLDLPTRPVFTSASGWQAGTPEELIGSRLDRHWEAAVQHLYRGDLEAWLAEVGRPDLAELARTCRKEHAQHSVGLEAFLEGTGLVPPPQVEVSPPSLDLEGPGPTVTTFLEIRNGGRGYLSGRIRVDVPWLTVDPQDFAGHRTRVEVTAHVEAFPGNQEGALLRLETPTVCWEVPVQARRIGVEQALDLYRSGEAARARLLCRRFLEARPGNADAWVLKAACHLQEGNPVGAVQALRDLVGGCRVLPSDVVERVFRWLAQDDPVSSGVDRVRVYEALLPCAEGPLAGEIRRSLGRVAFERSQVAAAALKSGGGASLWQGHRASAEDVIELLQLAAACDPTGASPGAAARSMGPVPQRQVLPVGVRAGLPLALTRRMRVTASSIRPSGIAPLRASRRVASNRPFQLSGAMARSSPALKLAAQSVTVQPATWPWPFQSPTTSPAKPIRPFSTSVSRVGLPWCLTPFQLEKLAITVSAPASIAAG